MTAQWQKLAARFDALLARERVLVLAAAVVGAALVVDALAIRPLEVRAKRLVQQLAESRQNIMAVDAAMKSRETHPDPGAVKRAYRDALRKQLAEIDRNMQGLQRGLVPPQRMASLLEEMLSRGRGLQLLSLRTLPAQRFETPGGSTAAGPGSKAVKPAPGDPQRTIYQHSFEIALQGSYVALHDYLTQLENLPWRMFWGRISVNSEQYPRLQVTLTVQTLSLNEAWLIV